MEKKFQPVFDTPVQSLSKESEEKLSLLKADLIAIRKMGRMEKFFGSENYRVVKSMVTTPTSIAGIILIFLFVLIALAAPLIMPPLPSAGADPYKIPRDGFSPVPKLPEQNGPMNPHLYLSGIKRSPVKILMFISWERPLISMIFCMGLSGVPGLP